MPYIKQEERKQIEDGMLPSTPGQLNYKICMTILEYLSLKPKIGYSEYNEIMGVLSCVEREIYRRLVAPLEDFKTIENGDIFPE